MIQYLRFRSIARRLRALDMWRARQSLSDEGVQTLAQSACAAQLEELDMGWCQGVGLWSHANKRDRSLVQLATRCPRLQKLFLTANRCAPLRSGVVSVFPPFIHSYFTRSSYFFLGM